MIFSHDTTVLFRNDSGETIPPNAIMRVTGAGKDDAGRAFITVDKPNSTFCIWYEVNGPSSVANGKIGETRDGICYASYDTGDGTPALFESWGAKSGQWKLAKNRSGFMIYGNTSTTRTRVLIRQFPVMKFIGKLAGTISQGSTATANIWVGGGGAESVSEYSVTIQDWLLPSSKSIVSGSKIVGEYINGTWYLVEAGACPSPS